MRSPIRQMIRPRSDVVILLQGPSSNALRAARTARSMSSASPSATRARVSPVAGSGVSNVLPDAASAHCPLMNSFRGAAMNSSTLRSRVTVMDAHLPLLLVLIVRQATRRDSYPIGGAPVRSWTASRLPARPPAAAGGKPGQRVLTAAQPGVLADVT